MRMLTLLLVVIGVTVSQARPQSGQDVLDNQEFVTTDNPQAVNIGDDDLELAGEGKSKRKDFFGAVHKLRHFKIDLYGSSNNDST